MISRRLEQYNMEALNTKLDPNQFNGFTQNVINHLIVESVKSLISLRKFIQGGIKIRHQ